MSQQGINNREKIVQAADQLFYVRGYNSTSFSDIAEYTGIPKGNFYYYFKSKDAILEAVLEHRSQLVSQMLVACEEHSKDAREQLTYLIEILNREEDNIIQYGCPIGSLSTELSKSLENQQPLVAAIFEQIRSWIEQRLQNLGFKQRAAILSMDLLARLQGASLLASIYRDVEFLRRSAEQHKQWLNQLFDNH